MSDSKILSVPTDFVLKYKGQEAFIGDVSPKGLLYLLQYGWNQSLQDAVAGFAKSLRDEGKLDDKGEPTGEDYTDEELAALVVKRMSDRAADIIEGDVGTRAGGVRPSRIDKVMRDVAREIVRGQATAQKKSMPTGDKLAEFVEQLVTKYTDVPVPGLGYTIRAEADRRLALQRGAADDAEALITIE